MTGFRGGALAEAWGACGNGHRLGCGGGGEVIGSAEVGVFELGEADVGHVDLGGAVGALFGEVSFLESGGQFFFGNAGAIFPKATEGGGGEGGEA